MNELDASRTSKAKLLTFCRTCGFEVGVWNTPYNKRKGDQRMKTSRHFDGAGRWCVGSMLTIDPHTAWENKAA